METDPQPQGKQINAQDSKGFIYRPTGSVTQNFGPVTYQLPRPLLTPLDLPERAEYFQDRKTELAQLLVDLQPKNVVTLCGPGGMGKSALAAEALWALADNKQLLERFPDGLLLHKFYTNRQVAVLMENIARVFGEELKPTPQEAAKRALSGRRVLLLLDGTEEADDLRAILEIRGECGVLITSRSRKDARAIRRDLPPLPPDDAVTLLQAWGGQQAADHEIAQQISQLVGRLPLALRLVGHYLSYGGEEANHYLAWLAETPLIALAHGKRQEESVPLLLERSLAQVSERARQALGVVGLLALSPFDGGAIAEALALSERETRQALGELVNYGLLILKEEVYEVSHALIHTYASQQLAPLDEVVVQLAAYYQQAIDTHKNDFAYVHPLRPHVMTLLSSASQRKIWEVVSSLAWGIEDYLDLQGYWADRITALTLNLAAAQATPKRQDEGRLLGNLGNAYASLGQVEQAIAYHQQALGISKEIGDRSNEGSQLGNLGGAYYSLGQVEQAIAYHQQALDIAKEIGDRRDEGTALGNLGVAYSSLGQVEQAITYYQQALVIAKEIGDRRGEGNRLGNLGNAYRNLGQVEEAITYYQQALVIAREIGDRRNEGNHLGNLGEAYYSLGQVEQAITYHQQALVIAREIGDRRNEGNQLGNLGVAYAYLGQVEQAIPYSQQALVISKEIGDRRGEGNQLGNLGNACFSLGQVEQAIAYSQQALAISKEIGDSRGEGAALGNLGNAYSSLGQAEQAIDYYQQALVISKEIGNRRGVGNWLGGLGNAYAELGQVERAITYYQQALAIAKETGNRRGEGGWLGGLGVVHAALGQVEQAIDYYQQALVIAKEIGDRRNEGTWLGNLGNAYADLGQVEQAIAYSQQALVISKEIGDRSNEGNWLGNLGNVYRNLGQVEQARQYYQQALQIFEQIKSPTAATVRQWLESLEK